MITSDCLLILFLQQRRKYNFSATLLNINSPRKFFKCNAYYIWNLELLYYYTLKKDNANTYAINKCLYIRIYFAIGWMKRLI